MKFTKFILFFLIAGIFFVGCGKTTPAPTSPPVLNSVTLSDTTDGSTSTTDELTVNVGLSATGNPTQMMLSESSNFATPRTANWVDYSATATFTFTGVAGTKTLYCKLKNSSGESNVVSQPITYQPPSPPPPPPPPSPPEWFTWWGGEAGHQIASANAVMYDQPSPLNEKSAGWIGVYPYAGPQDDPNHITNKLNQRLNQGFSKAFFEVERGLSRNEIQALKTWATAHPDFKLFLWMVSYNWIHPYGSPPAEGYFDSTGRQYCYWDEFEGSPSNMILCWMVYFSLHGMIDTDFTNDTDAAAKERAYLDANYLPFIEQFGLKNQSLFVLCLGGYKSENPNFDLNDLTREMNLCKEKLPLGMGFFGTTEGWSNEGAIDAANNFCAAWLAE